MKLAASMLLAALAAGCSAEAGPTLLVALNGRVFDVPAHQPSSAPAGEPLGTGVIATPTRSCTVYDLHANGESTSDEDVFGLTVTQRADGDETVEVEVAQGGRVVVDRRYDEGFFQSGQADEFFVPTSSTDVVKFVYWGAIDPHGVAGCPPLAVDGP